MDNVNDLDIDSMNPEQIPYVIAELLRRAVWALERIAEAVERK